jgi:glycerol-3-phosphate dehydrogenase
MIGVTHQKTRAEYLLQIRQNPAVPVLIVGGTCHTAMLLRELALQGVPALLISPQDYWMETAVTSPYLIHNDVSYRENGGFRTVKKAMAERQHLLQIAPHAVHTITTTIPIFRWVTGRFHFPIKLPQEADKTGRRGILFTRLGLMMQDRFTRAKGTLLSHEFALRDASLSQFPALNPDILGTATYHNAIVPFPQQLCQEMVADALHASPKTVALNYISVQNLQDNSIVLQDNISGERFSVQPQLVFQQIEPQQQHKSIFLVIDHAELNRIIDRHAFFFEHENGRFVRIYPFNSRVMINATFPELSTSSTNQLTKDDVANTLDLVQQLFPQISIQPNQIRFQHSSAVPEQTTTQAHLKLMENNPVTFPIYQLPPPNWNNFHSVAHTAADQVLRHLAQPKVQQSKNLPLGGGKGYLKNTDERWRWFHKISREQTLAFEHVKLLFSRYGTQSRTVAAFLSKAPDLPLKHSSDYTQREIAYLIKTGQVVHLDDLILRRTQLAQRGDISAALVAEIGQIASKVLNWSQDQLQKELERTFTLLAKSHGVSLY